MSSAAKAPLKLQETSAENDPPIQGLSTMFAAPLPTVALAPSTDVPILIHFREFESLWFRIV
jgi:hypothetical protein